MSLLIDRSVGTAPTPLRGSVTQERAVPRVRTSHALGRARSRRRLRTTEHVLSLVLVLTVLGQRFGLPAGTFTLPALVITTYVAAVALLIAGLVRLDRLRTELFLLAMTGCFLAAYLTTFTDSPMSTASLLLLSGVYAPWVLTIQPRYREAFSTVATTFVRLMLLLSVVGVGQMLAQVSGVWAWQDYLRQWVPTQFLLTGFNTSNPISYLNPIHKATAFVFLEPSFLSQFCALALIVGVVRRVPAWQLLVLVAGLASSLSGTGILLLGFGLVVIALRDPRAIRLRYAVASVLTLAVVFATPVAGILLKRTDEIGEQGSSGYMRFVQPYQEVFTGLALDPSRYLFGAGPGTSERLLTSDRLGLGQPVVYTIPAKLLFEYGVVAGSLFMLFLVVAVLQSRTARALPSSLLFMTFLLSGALLQPHTMYLAWLLSSFWGGPKTTARTERRARRRPSPPRERARSR